MDVFAPVPTETEHVATAVIGAAIEVHRQLGLHARGLPFERERAVVVHYRGVPIPGQRIDLIVSGCVLVELNGTTAEFQWLDDQAGSEACRRLTTDADWQRFSCCSLSALLVLSSCSSCSPKSPLCPSWLSSSWPSQQGPRHGRDPCLCCRYGLLLICRLVTSHFDVDPTFESLLVNVIFHDTSEVAVTLTAVFDVTLIAGDAAFVSVIVGSV